MAGHNKWSKVKRQKGVTDAKRAKVFAKLAREIGIAVRAGGPEADLNPRLRMILLKCRSANMPADNIERAIKRAAGDDDATNFEELTYEIFAPGGVAVLVHASTDNRNRTASDVRHLVTKAGGQLASAGSVTRLFERKGQIIIERTAADEDTLMELALDAGAADFNTDENGYEIVTEPNDFEQVHKAVEEKGISTLSAEVTSIALQTTTVDDSGAAALSRLVDALEENDDVSDVYTNADSPGDA
ncbi:MAG TPA: YebC/PmpR family DNA-binding transcriptional regulator [Verrucomicrobiales bacterium]|nr:YebC/PmpR family DNA-binding transcriptional regulator [Verrucomicrobiales bacterium]|tara:strand:+ start:1648 stop:2379 length:732 start_codon:yes stop_codon:yes gene_type:complete